MKSERVELVPIERDSIRWQKLAAAIAMNFCPAIYACKQCNYPVILGYCCEFCGTGEPR